MKNLNLDFRHNYDLFGPDAYDELHWGKLFIHLFDSYFSSYSVEKKYKMLEFVAEIRLKYNIPIENVIKIEKEVEANAGDNKKTEEIFLIIKNGFCVSMFSKGMRVLYNTETSFDEVYELVKLGEKFIKPKDIPKRKIHMIRNSTYNGLELESFDITPCDIDLNTHYNHDFQEIHNIIHTSLNEKKNGLILLHGTYGTGKTYYLRHLINTIDRQFVFFPLHMVEAISTPDFMPFLAENPNAVLILEDCESILIKRENSPYNSSALSTLLNLGDGLLADALKINVICTFNSHLTRIDEALLRKGRLIAKYEFKHLEHSKAQSLAYSLGYDEIVDKQMTVSEIYNLKEMSFESQKRPVVGF